MREIKFRGKMIPENEWIYGTLLRIPHPPVCIGKEKIDKYYIQFADPRYMPDWNMPYKMVQGEVIPETIGQYTGLKDKNGKEIYEGDIVKCSFYPDYIFEIKFEELCWYMRKITTSEYIELASVFRYEIEVIGNVWDNLELLEEKE